jgi:hypothetical protein
MIPPVSRGALGPSAQAGPLKIELGGTRSGRESFTNLSNGVSSRQRKSADCQQITDKQASAGRRLCTLQQFLNLRSEHSLGRNATTAVMVERRCRYCDGIFQPWKYQPEQLVCSDPACQRRRRAGIASSIPPPSNRTDGASRFGTKRGVCGILQTTTQLST